MHRAAIGQALDLLAKFKSALQKNRVKTIEDFENEGTLDLGGEFREQPVSAEAKSLFHYFAKTKSIKQCYEFLNEYCRLAEREELDTPDMFGRPPAGRAELLEQAEKNVDERRRQTEGPDTGNDLFAGRDLRELRQPGTPAQKPAAPADRTGVAERPSPVQGEVTPATPVVKENLTTQKEKTLEKIEEGKRYSLEKRPKNIEEFRQMESHPRPESVKFESVKELYGIYKQEYLGKTFNTISGQKITFKPGHFFRLIAGTPKEGRKGWIAKAANAADAIRMIENGEVDFADIAGYQETRAKNINLFKDVLQDGDFWYPENNQRIVFGKKYQGLKDADGFVAVTLELDNQGDLGPVSFHPQRFSDKMFEGKEITWNIANSLDHANALEDISSRGKSTELNDNISETVENSSADTEKNQKFSSASTSLELPRQSDQTPVCDFFAGTVAFFSEGGILLIESPEHRSVSHMTNYLWLSALLVGIGVAAGDPGTAAFTDFTRTPPPRTQTGTWSFRDSSGDREKEKEEANPRRVEWSTTTITEDAYGPGVHSDQTGRPIQYDPPQPPQSTVKPDVYGPGVGQDAFGRPVRLK